MSKTLSIDKNENGQYVVMREADIRKPGRKGGVPDVTQMLTIVLDVDELDIVELCARLVAIRYQDKVRRSGEDSEDWTRTEATLFASALKSTDRIVNKVDRAKRAVGALTPSEREALLRELSSKK